MNRLLHILADAKDALLGLKRRPLRSFLSGLGIGIGVMALVTMLSISEGGRREAMAKIESLGINKLRLENATKRAAVHEVSLMNLSQGLLEQDARRLKAWLGEAAQVTRYVREDEVAAAARDLFATVTVLGVDPAWFHIEGLHLLWGRALVAEDLRAFRRVCVLGHGVAQALHIHGETTLRMRNAPCQVIGVLRPKGRLLTEGTRLSAMDFDQSVYLPLTAFPFRRTGGARDPLDGIVVALADRNEKRILDTADQVDERLRQYHRGVEDYVIVAPLNLLREARETHRLFALITGAIAGLSLLVGGIGVMNIMLANISEQTREIGLRMAVGATRARIVSLFLWHSVLLTVSGAAWGLLLGVACAFAIQHYAGWQVGFSLESLVIGPLAAVGSGVVFGLHPALRAASLEPAIALRDAQ